MNTKELAKLLLKHPLIKKINESQLWNRSIVSRVIAEELMSEQDKNQSIKDMEAAIELLKKQIAEKRQALLDAGKSWRQALEFDEGDAGDWKELMTQLDTERRAKIKQLDAMEASYEELKNKAAETPETKPKEVATPDEKEFERAELKGLIQTLQDDIDFYIEKFGEENVPEDVRGRLADAKKDLEAIDKASEAITDKAAESDNPKIEKAAKLVNRDTAEKVAQANKKIEAAKESPPKVKASEIEKAVEEIPTEPLKKATEKIVKSEPEPEPQPEPIPEPIPYQIKWKSLGDSYARKAKAKLSDVKYAYLKQLIDIYAKRDIDSWKQRHPKIAEKTTDDQIVAFLEQNADKLAKKYANFFKEYEAGLKSNNEKAVEKVENEIEQQEKEEETTAFQLVTPEDQVDEKAEKYREIGEGLLKAEQFQGLKLAQNPLFQIYAAFWLSKETGQDMRVDELKLKDIPNNRIQEFIDENLLSKEQQSEFLKTIKDEMESFKNLLNTLKKFSGSIDDDEEEKEKLLPQVIKAADEEVPPVPDLQKLSQVKFQDFLIGLLSKGLPLKADDEIIDITPEDEDITPEDEEETKLLTGPVQKKEAQEEAQEDIQPERETPPQVFSEQHYTTLATFFADEGARGLGFMQQLLLRRQSEQLYGLIETLNELIDPTGGEEAALTREVLGEQQEENTTEQGMELEPSEKRKLKSELLGLLSALRSLKTLSKAYEENLTRTSVDPRYDGSSLKKRLDAMLPDIQNSIARILKMIKDFLAELPKVEPMGSEEVVQEQEGKGLDRESKIDLVDDTYKEMRKMWPILKTALQEQTEEPKEENIEEQEDASKATETVVSTAREMRELASSKPFIDFFPTITFSQEGQVVSINQANNVLSGVISQFVYVMRNVVALVKGEELTEGTAIEVKQKLADIANAIEESFGVPASRIVKQIEKETAGDPENQSLTDTPSDFEGIVLPEPEGELEFDDEEEDVFPPLVTGDDEEDTPEAEEEPEEEEADEEDEEELFDPEFDVEDHYGMNWRDIFEELDLDDRPTGAEDPLDEMLEDLKLGEITKEAIGMHKNDFKDLMPGLQQEFVEMVEVLQSIEKHFKPTRERTNENVFKQGVKAFNRMGAKRDLIKRVSKLEGRQFEGSIKEFKKDLKGLKLNFLVPKQPGDEFWDKLQSSFFKQFNKQPTRSNDDSIEETLREALKPIIAKMLKEHHG